MWVAAEALRVNDNNALAKKPCKILNSTSHKSFLVCTARFVFLCHFFLGGGYFCFRGRMKKIEKILSLALFIFTVYIYIYIYMCVCVCVCVCVMKKAFILLRKYLLLIVTFFLDKALNSMVNNNYKIRTLFTEKFGYKNLLKICFCPWIYQFTLVCTYTHTHTYTHTQTNKHTNKQTLIYIYIYTYARTHTNTNIETQKHKQTHTRNCEHT